MTHAHDSFVNRGGVRGEHKDRQRERERERESAVDLEVPLQDENLAKEEITFGRSDRALITS
jgi:hypothetical protein